MLSLKFINLKRSFQLFRFLDVSGAQNAERLILLGCYNLEEVHKSLGFLKRLIYLDMNRCWNLKFLPSRLEMESLETLILSSCQFLERFPAMSPCMIKNIPNSISELNCIKSLDLRNCWELQNIPDEFGRLENLQELHLPLAHGSITFYVLTNLCSLRKLDLSSSQIRDKDFPENLHKLSSLEALNLSYNNELLELLASISYIPRLKLLDVHECDNFVNIDRLPSGIQALGISRSKIPSWFKEQQHGQTITLKLPPKWQTQIIGFAISTVFKPRRLYNEPSMELRFENDRMHVHKPQIDASSKSKKENLWIGYVPLSLLETMHDDGEDKMWGTSRV
ncbi:TMV resistance protein N-like protein [Tanacetum coccineum]